MIARTIRLAACCWVGEMFPEHLEHNRLDSWDTILDECTFLGSGLRMIGSDKCSDCPCKKRNGCDDCNFPGPLKGKIAENRPYNLQDIRDIDGNVIQREMDKLKNKNGGTDFLRIVKLCTIRARINTPLSVGFVKYDGAETPLYPHEVQMKTVGRGKYKRKRPKHSVQLPSNEPRYKKASPKELECALKLLAQIKILNPVYSKLHL